MIKDQEKYLKSKACLMEEDQSMNSLIIVGEFLVYNFK